MKALSLILSLLILPVVETAGQQLHFREYQLPVEYRNESINIIYPSSDNFIWLGTSIGLFRFDGTEYKHFLRDSVKSNEISTLFEDHNGVLWIGYKSGEIGKFLNKNFIPFSPEEGFPKVPVTGFAEDADKNLWFSTYGEGAYCYINNRLYNFNIDDGLPDDYVYTLLSDRFGKIWLGTDRGIAVCSFKDSKKEISVINASGILPDNIVTALSQDSSGVWIGMESEGVCRYNHEKETLDFYTSDWNYGRVSSLILKDEKIWAGTTGNGVVEIDFATNDLYLAGTPENSMSRVTAMVNDKEGNVWLSTGSSSAYITSNVFTFIHQAHGNLLNNIQAVLRTRSGNVWYSSEAGLYELIPQKKEPTGFKQRELKLKDEKIHVISMYEDNEGQLWFGTFDHGVFHYDPITENVQQLSEDNGLVNNNVLSITGRGNEIWFATLGGVSQYEVQGGGFNITNYTSQSGLGSNYIYHAYADSQGRIWFATDGRGITMLEDRTLRNFSSSEGLKSNIIYSITEDASGNIWASTSNTGLYRFEENKFIEYTPLNGLRDLSITSIVGDSKGNILIISKSGIDILDPSTGLVFHNDDEAGISQIDPNLNAYSTDPEGNIWLGTQSGIIKYSPSENFQWPKTKINEMQVFLNPYSKGNPLLAHDQNHISFDYMGLWYHDPGAVTYLVKLEGYDREWARSRNNFITYPNLPPGEYTFKVKSSTTGYFDDVPAQAYAFTIAPPFYNSIWFYLLLVSFTGGLMLLYIKSREKKLKIAERQKKEQVEFRFETLKSQVNPHFLFNSFNTLVAVIEEDQETAVEYVEKLSDFYRKILEYREQNVIPLKDELEMITNYHFLQMKRYKDNFRLKIDISADQQQKNIPPMTLQLLVENAVKHNIISRDKPLSIDIYDNEDYLIVKNNLQPRNHQEPSTGMGLNNIIHRFGILTDREVKIEQTEEYFIVRVPLLVKKI